MLIARQSLFNPKRLALVAVFFCFLLLIAGCSKPINPDDVTIAFWTALAENNLEKATNYSTEGSAQLFNEKLRNASVQVGKVKYDCDSATVRTHITLQSAATRSTFKTVLIRDTEQNRWKVDYPRTVGNISDKQFKNVVTSIKETGEVVKSSGWDFIKGLGSSIADIFIKLKDRLIS